MIRGRLRWALVAGAAAALGGCGEDGSGASRPEDPVREFFFNIDDGKRACATISRERIEIDGGPEKCIVAIERERKRRPESVAIRDVDRRGPGRAEVDFKVTPGKSGTATVVREDGRWRIDSFD